MKKLLFLALIAVSVSLVLTSCGHGITIQEAANKKQKCGRNWVR